MNLISVNNLGRIAREGTLFSGVTFGLDEGQKAALIGRNGTGKSTLLSTIAGVLEADEGSVTINKSCGVSFLPQNPAFNPEDSIHEHIFKNVGAKDSKLAVIKEYEELCTKLGNSNELVQKRYEELLKIMDERDLWNYESQVNSILSTLGINGTGRKMGELSGGMLKKVALAQVLVEDTKLLLLDEPTNHLDIDCIYWLQEYLRTTKRSVLMVTHDRYFLDSVCSDIYELDRQKVKLYQGNYSSYLEKKEIEREIEANTERRIESVLRFERDWLRRGPCARGTKPRSRVEKIKRMIGREKFREAKGFAFEVSGKRLGGKVLELEGITKNFPKGNQDSKNSAPVIKDFSYNFTKGQRIGIFGSNGSGKSTLLNIITGNLAPDSGSVSVGENTSFGYYMQNPVFKDQDLTVLEYIQEVAEHIQLNDGRNLSASIFLEEFSFNGKMQHSAIKTLSGGEKKRLFLVRLLISNPNFLILDEPTNDFDIYTMNVLESFLQGFKGCLLVVSHDRYFMDKVVDTLFILNEDGSVSGYVGKCSEYLQDREEILQALAEEKSEKAQLERQEQKSAKKTEDSAKRKMSFKEKKEFESLESEIAELEEKKSLLEEKMSTDFSNLAQLSKEYESVSSLLDSKYARWEELAELN